MLGGGAIVAGGYTRRAWGAIPLMLMAALAALTAISMLWAVDPSAAWVEANRTTSYLAVFAIGISLVRLAPERWSSLLGATVVAAVVISGYALLTKTFPSLNADEVYARLRQPFGYWNAVGVMAALGVPGCLWLGSRRTGHALLNTLAYPALGLLLITMLMAYSRGSLLAVACGCVVWFAAGALLVLAWAFAQPGLSKDHMSMHDRATAGHEFLGLLVVVLGLLLLAGLAVGFALAQRAPSEGTRRQVGLAVLVCVGLVPVALVGALALSQRGLGGSISKDWNDLTNPNAKQPANTADRLTAVGSVRALYWSQALKVFRAHKAIGVGADGYAIVRTRYRKPDDRLDVRHAHGYIVQTLADFGLAGLAVSLALLAAWLASALRTCGLWRGMRGTPYSPERIGMLTLLSVVVVFGVHSLVDWTWFVPANAMLALLCAGWLAGRGPVVSEPYPAVPLLDRLRAGARVPWRAAAAGGALAIALVAAWTALQPQRAVDAANSALIALDHGNKQQALADANHAHSINPLSVDPLYDRAVMQEVSGDKTGARRTLGQAVRLQPSNPDPWLHLAQFDLDNGRPHDALRSLGAALYLDPNSADAQQAFIQAQRQLKR